MVFASQCIIQSKPRSMRITVDGTLRPGVEAKDCLLYTSYWWWDASTPNSQAHYAKNALNSNYKTL